MKTKLLNVLGKEVGEVTLNPSIFEITPHQQAMFDQVLSERNAQRQLIAKTKVINEVRGGGKKPWAQKHTGRARHASIRSPIWRGGGIVHGPGHNRNFTTKLNKKVVKLAMKSGWSLKAKEEALIIVDKIDFRTPSTKDFSKLLKNLKADAKRTLMIVSADAKDHNTYLSGRNMKNVEIVTTKKILLDDILKAKRIIMTPEVLHTIEGGLN